MIPTPIQQILTAFQAGGVQAPLMGGQACVLYGAAEFSRDADLAVLSAADNLDRLTRTLEVLCAQSIAVPPFSQAYLDRGHVVHFRCTADGVEGVRIDIMARMRGLLLECANAFPRQAERLASVRPAVARALRGDAAAVEGALDSELRAERDADRAYWAPLLAELEQLRRTAREGR